MRGATGSRPVVFLGCATPLSPRSEVCSTWNKASQPEVLAPTGIGAFHVEQTSQGELL